MTDVAINNETTTENTEPQSAAEMMAELQRLKEENAKLKVEKKKALGLKVSQKGGVSLYGLGRFPVTLYKEQWLKLLDKAEEIKAFIEANDDQLATK